MEQIKLYFNICILFFSLLFYLKRNKEDYLFIYLITSLPLLLSSIFDLKNKIILRVSGKIRFTFFRKFIFFISKKKIIKVLFQTLESKKKELYRIKFFPKNILALVRDPVIDHNDIEKLKKEQIEKFFLKKNIFFQLED